MISYRVKICLIIIIIIIMIISAITKRYSKANNPYLGKDYNPDEPTNYIQYLDVNNLYGWAMSKPLPVDGFEWMPACELPHWDYITDEDGVGSILEVDLEYPDELHDVHNEYPLASESLKIGKVDKLIPNLQDKMNYVIHYKNLQQCLDLGMKLTKIHRAIKFNERAWLKDNIQLNTDLRTKRTTDFEKDFFKLMNNYLQIQTRYATIYKPKISTTIFVTTFLQCTIRLHILQIILQDFHG